MEKCHMCIFFWKELKSFQYFCMSADDFVNFWMFLWRENLNKESMISLASLTILPVILFRKFGQF